MSTNASYLQGRVVIDQDLTIRFTDAASSATVDVAFTADDTFTSFDAVAAPLQTQIRAAGGNFNDWTVSITNEDESFLGTKDAGSVKFTTGHTGISINFNQGGAGTGTNLRTYLGHSAASSGSSSSTYYFNAKSDAVFVPSRSFLRASRTRTSSIVMHQITLGGHVNTQWNVDGGANPVIDLALSIQFNTESSFLEMHEFETFFDTVFDNVCSGEPFSVFHDGDTWECVLSSGYPVFDYSRMIDGFNGAWRVDVSLSTWSDVE